MRALFPAVRRQDPRGLGPRQRSRPGPCRFAKSQPPLSLRGEPHLPVRQRRLRERPLPLGHSGVGEHADRPRPALDLLFQPLDVARGPRSRPFPGRPPTGPSRPGSAATFSAKPVSVREIAAASFTARRVPFTCTLARSSRAPFSRPAARCGSRPSCAPSSRPAAPSRSWCPRSPHPLAALPYRQLASNGCSRPVVAPQQAGGAP